MFIRIKHYSFIMQINLLKKSSHVVLKSQISNSLIFKTFVFPESFDRTGYFEVFCVFVQNTQFL